MTVNISTQARNNSGNAIVDLIDVGSINSTGTLKIMTGTKPASPQATATGTILTTHSLSKPAFGNFSNGTAIANTISDDSDIANTGTASWFRIYDCDNNAVIDGDITITGGGGDIEFDTVDFIKGGTVTITSLQGIMPQ